MGGTVQSLVGSIQEGTEAFAQSIGHAVEGDWEEAGKDFARVGLEAAGAAGTMFLGPGAEVAQEAIEGALDNAVLERPTGDVPGPGGGKADWSFDNLLSGAVEGGAEGAMGAFGGMSGGSGSLGNVLGAFSGGGGGGTAGLEQMLGSALGGQSGGVEQFMGSMSDFGDAAQLMGNMQSEAGYVRGQVIGSSI